MVATKPIIQTSNLTKVYKNGKEEKRALDNLNLSIEPGEIFGYLGPNGAGKTTTIRLLLDIIRPTSGKGLLFGQDAHANSVELHKRVGFLPGELNLWKNLSGSQVVQYVGSVRGGVDMSYVQQLAKRLELDLSIKVRSYSSGNRRKLGILLAMMNKPELLILDEPTNGLDPLVQQTFHQMMREVRADGRTVFLSSHVLNEVQEICDRVGILRDGQLKAVERVADLTRADFHWVTVQFRDPVSATLRLAEVPGVSEVSTTGNMVRLRLAGDFDPLLHALSQQYVIDLQVQEPTLEEIFLTFYGDGTRREQLQQNHVAKEVVR